MNELTKQQAAVVEALKIRQPCGPRSIAGELDLRSQDAGRILRALERKGVVEFHVPEPGQGAGYRLVPKHATKMIHLLGLACGLGETADELREGSDPGKAADYIEMVADQLWVYVGHPERRAPEAWERDLNRGAARLA